MAATLTFTVLVLVFGAGLAVGFGAGRAYQVGVRSFADVRSAREFARQRRQQRRAALGRFVGAVALMIVTAFMVFRAATTDPQDVPAQVPSAPASPTRR